MDIDIEYVAKLARIELTDAQKKKFSQQLGDILAYIDKLKELDVSLVEPMSHVLALKNVFRQDKVRPSLPLNKTLSNSPSVSGDNFFSVPKVIE
jgi:aspartyl-tRNA(Asn)/glutamyl-tRNA(Gln) amidotransferase subunit C